MLCNLCTRNFADGRTSYPCIAKEEVFFFTSFNVRYNDGLSAKNPNMASPVLIYFSLLLLLLSINCIFFQPDRASWSDLVHSLGNLTWIQMAKILFMVIFIILLVYQTDAFQFFAIDTKIAVLGKYNSIY